MKSPRPALPVKPRYTLEIPLRRLPAQFIRQRRHIFFRQQRRFLRSHHPREHSTRDNSARDNSRRHNHPSHVPFLRAAHSTFNFARFPREVVAATRE
jgi:hypothetical protein